MNPIALLMNDVAVASLAYAIVGNSKVISVYVQVLSMMKKITYTGRYIMDAKQVINIPQLLPAKGEKDTCIS